MEKSSNDFIKMLVFMILPIVICWFGLPVIAFLAIYIMVFISNICIKDSNYLGCLNLFQKITILLFMDSMLIEKIEWNSGLPITIIYIVAVAIVVLDVIHSTVLIYRRSKRVFKGNKFININIVIIIYIASIFFAIYVNACFYSELNRTYSNPKHEMDYGLYDDKSNMIDVTVDDLYETNNLNMYSDELKKAKNGLIKIPNLELEKASDKKFLIVDSNFFDRIFKIIRSEYFYFSTTTFFTVGYGDIVMKGHMIKYLAQLEMFIALIINAIYLPLLIFMITNILNEKHENQSFEKKFEINNNSLKNSDISDKIVIIEEQFDESKIKENYGIIRFSDRSLIKINDDKIRWFKKTKNLIKSEVKSRNQNDSAIRCEYGDVNLISIQNSDKYILNIANMPKPKNDAEKNYDENNNYSCTKTYVDLIRSGYKKALDKLVRAGCENIVVPIIEESKDTDLILKVCVQAINNFLVKLKDEDEELYSNIDEIKVIVLDKENINKVTSLKNSLCGKKLSLLNKESYQLYLNDLNAYDSSKRGYFGILKWLRIGLLKTEKAFPLTSYLKENFSKEDWKKRRIVLEIKTVFQVLIPALGIVSFNKNNWFINAIFISVTGYFLLETIIYITKLIVLSDIQSPGASSIRSLVLVFLNYIELKLCFIFWHKIFDLLQDFYQYGVFFESLVKAYFVGAIVVYFINNCKPRRFING